MLVRIESTSRTGTAEAVEEIKKQEVTSLNIVVANAGINPLNARLEVIDQLHNILNVNTFSFVTLFKAVHPLLMATVDSKGEGAAKLPAISSYAGRLVAREASVLAKVGSYGTSMLGLNYLVRRAHFENPWLTAWVNDPGFANGNATARVFSLSEASVTIEQFHRRLGSSSSHGPYTK